MTIILAIDLGTSGPKVALVTVAGEVVAHAAAETPVTLLPGGGAEQDPADWWRAIKEAVRQLWAESGVDGKEVTAVACTAQWSGTVPVDKAGKPLMNAIIWMDSRGAKQVQAITGGSVNVQGYGPGKLLTWLRLTGGIPTLSGKDSIAHILYIKEHLPQIYRDTHKFMEPKDYLNLLLTDRFTATYDSITLHWLTDNRNLTRVEYSPQLLQMAGIPREKLPDLLQAVDVVGPLLPQAAAELGVPAGVPVVAGTPDVHSAAIGAGAVDDYEAHLYLGTSSWLICHVPFKKTDLMHNMASLPAAIPGRYLLINEQESAGGCLNYLIENLFYPDDALALAPRPPDVYERLNEAAAAVPAGSDRLIFTPWLYGERSPVDDHAVRSCFFNQSLHTTRSHLVRAVFEGVAYNSRWLLQYVEKFIGRQLPHVRVIGGGARSDLWCQILADVFDRPIWQVADPLQVNARGVALLTAVSRGYLAWSDVPHQVKIRRRYRPNPAHREIYDALFREFVNLYKQNRRAFARLNKHNG